MNIVRDKRTRKSLIDLPKFSCWHKWSAISTFVRLCDAFIFHSQLIDYKFCCCLNRGVWMWLIIVTSDHSYDYPSICTCRYDDEYDRYLDIFDLNMFLWTNTEPSPDSVWHNHKLCMMMYRSMIYNKYEYYCRSLTEEKGSNNLTYQLPYFSRGVCANRCRAMHIQANDEWDSSHAYFIVSITVHGFGHV